MYIEHVFLYSQREFTTGEDHTTEVHDIEKNLIGYQNSSVSVCVSVCEREKERVCVCKRKCVCRCVREC